MAEPNRPQGREKYVTDNSKGVHRRGEGLGTGPVGGGQSNVNGQRPGAQSFRPSAAASGSGGRTTRASGKSPLLLVLVAALVLGGGGGIAGLFGGGNDAQSDAASGGIGSSIVETVTGQGSGQSAGSSGGGQSSGGSISGLSSLLGSGITAGALNSLAGSSGAVSSGVSSSLLNNLGAGQNASSTGTSSSPAVWSAQSDLDEGVVKGARAKYTKILGAGRDTVTIMVYMCGTDLESRSAMATKDLLEMTRAKLGNNVRVVVYTGGCTKWNNQVVAADRNQIYEVVSGGLRCVQDNAGKASMTEPDTLSGFIKWCAKNYPASRNELILWDHGGGSVSGYGYDEKYARSGSMSLAGVDKALTAGGVKFDFVGFDACLMATVETGLMLADHADYMIASEETEPGIGWYYTDWLTELGSNPGMSTVQIGRRIADSFVSTCASECRGQSATLSVVDLAELDYTAPAALKDFSKSLSDMIQNKEYAEISTARNNSREFARSNAIDQIDLVHFANNLGTAESAALSEALLGAVKYNRASSDMRNSYGLSIYFPYRKTSNVNAAVNTYSAIGMDDSYSQCIREFAALELSGQVGSGGGLSANPLDSLLGGLSGGSSGSADLLGGLLGSFLSGGGADFFSGRALSDQETVDYISAHYFDDSYLVWQDRGDGQAVISMPEAQWDLVRGLELNLFVDDGEGFVDLGLDNVYEFDENGYLLPCTDRTWLAINGQPVAYYHEYSSGDVTTGRVPALLNGTRVDLILVFDAEHPRGYLAGARPVYTEGETDTVAKSLTELELGDSLDFLCDFYRYDGTFEDSYYLGEQMVVTETMEISNVDVGAATRQVYRFTDLYQQHYWTVPLDD